VTDREEHISVEDPKYTIEVTVTIVIGEICHNNANQISFASQDSNYVGRTGDARDAVRQELIDTAYKMIDDTTHEIRKNVAFITADRMNDE
jgi:hypothetical protein